ncbi:ATP-binding cassette domain-containing protein [Staphylococcus sp. HMSC62A08]|uniref:ATP-binding cassette domain-containing protein n=1 Tax=Staphylococcus TaxID=1279 RepID=UPI0008A94A5D|nr:ATP-binding cassette domain-containing protein [Staphylococcus sp. HMSC62A08]OHS39879.1 bacitracin ABC transporter ATP-binding protein [Staphylococcus sp. HMSC62A08]
MVNLVLKTSNLSKNFKNTQALKNVNMNLKYGDIYGFIGENGSGKTTLIRIISGLSYQSSGEIELFGQSTNLNTQRYKLGAMVENPMLYPNLTAKQNLEVERIQRGIPGQRVVDETLNLVGLSDTNNKKVKNFSLGMKQRLGLASALLASPELLILDEPTNGLDPMGIVDLRELLLKISEEKNIAILISSHILGELYQLANCYGFIHDGKLVEEISAKELKEKCNHHLSITVDNSNKASAILQSKLNIQNFEVYPNNEIKIYDYSLNSGIINKTLLSNDILVYEVTTKGENLENYYKKLIGGGKHD